VSCAVNDCAEAENAVSAARRSSRIAFLFMLDLQIAAA
jgi:hypothetical protein